MVSAGFDFPHLRQNLFAAGSGNNDPTSRRPEAQSEPDADRRRRSPGEVVLRAKAEPDRIAPHRRNAPAPNERPCDSSLALVIRTTNLEFGFVARAMAIQM